MGPEEQADGAKKPGKNRATAAQAAERIDEVFRIRLDGAEFHDVKAFAQEKGWNVSDRQVRRYIEQADKLNVERLERSRRKLLARHISQRQSLFGRALNAADYRTALAVLRDIAELQGLYFSASQMKELERDLREQKKQLEQLEREFGLTATPPDPQLEPKPTTATSADAEPPAGE